MRLKAQVSNTHDITWDDSSKFPLRIAVKANESPALSADEVLALRDALIEVMPLDNKFKHWEKE